MSSQVRTKPQRSKTPAQATRVKHYVDEQLKKTREQVKTVDLVYTICVWFAATIAFFVLAAIVDGWIWSFNHFARWFCLIGLTGGSLAYFFLVVFPLIFKKINPVYAAKMIEESKPGFKNSVVNYVDFRQNPNRLRPAIFDAVSRQAATDLAGVPDELNVDRSKLIRVGFVICGLTLVLVGYKMFSPKDPVRTMFRILAPSGKISKPSLVDISDVEPGDSTLFFGDPLTVSATIKGQFSPQDARLVYSTLDGQLIDQSVLMEPTDEPDRFQAVLSMPGGGVQQSLSYFVKARDGKSPQYEIEVRPNPAISIDSIVLSPPKYTELPSQTLTGQGDIEAVEGTQVEIHAVANLPIDIAYIELLNEIPVSRDQGTIENQKEFRVASKPIEMRVDGTSAVGKFQAVLNSNRERPIASHYRVKFVSVDGDRSRNPNVFPIRIIPDLAPEVRIQNPVDKDVQIPVNGSVSVDVIANDLDFKIRNIRMHVDHQGKSILDSKLRLNSENDNRMVKSRMVLRPDKLGLKPGDQALFFVTAEDNRISPYSDQADPNISRTQNYSLTIMESDPDQDPEKDSNQQGSQKSDSDSSQKDGERGSESGKNGDSEQDGEASGDSDSTDQDSKDSGTESGSDSDGSEDGDPSKDGQQGSSNQNENGNQSGSGDESDPDSNKNSTEDGSDPDSSEQGSNGEQDNRGNSGDNQAGSNQDGNQADPSMSGGGNEAPDSDSSKEESQQNGNGGQNSEQSDSSNNDRSQQNSNGLSEGESESSGGSSSGDGQQDPNLTDGSKEVLDENASEGERFRAAEEYFEEQDKKENDSDSNQPNNEKKSDNQEGSESGSDGDSNSKTEEKDRSNKSSQKSDQNKGSEPNESQSQQDNSAQKGGSNQSQDQNNQLEKQREKESDSGNQGSQNQQDQNSESQSSDNSNSQGSQNSQQSSDSQGSEQSSDSQGSQAQAEDGAQNQDPSQPNENAQQSESSSQGSQQSDQSDSGQNNSGSQSGESGNSQESENESSDSQSEPQQGNQPGDQASDSSASGDASQNQMDHGESNSSSQSSSDGQPSSNQSSSQNASRSNQKAANGSGSAGSGQGSLEKEKTNLDHARQKTDLILEKLAEQKNNPDPELLDKINWTKEELNEFVDRWKEMKAAAESGGDREKRRYKNALKSLDFRPKDARRRVQQTQQDTSGLNQDGVIDRPSPKVENDFNSFLRNLNRIDQ
ncbi:MAG: hypothetical protein AAF623_01330 [Planctomycetota bacterium]